MGGIEIIQTSRVRQHWLIQVGLFLGRWSPEFLLAVVLVWAVAWVHHHTDFNLVMSGLAVYSAVVSPLALRPVRRWVWTVAGMNVTRHRIRAFFVNCRVYNRDGKLPVITLITPTAVGEKVRLWLPAGLSINDLASATEELASACWARDARVARSRRYSMVVEVHVIRRDPLATTQPVQSAFSGQLADVLGEKVAGMAPAPQDVQEGVLFIPPARPATSDSSASSPATKAGASKPTVKDSVSSSVVVGGEDVSDYL